jgi:dihydroxyacid dehydratase/phosphogluconate dehydratase
VRSDAWLAGDDEVALNHRAALRQAGTGRPLIGIACTASDLNRCDRGLTELAEAVRIQDRADVHDHRSAPLARTAAATTRQASRRSGIP